MKRTILRMLDEAASKWPAAPYALRKTDAGFVAVSFAEARERSREFAAWLLSAGFRRGDAAAILAEGSPEWIMGEFGLMMAGCVSVPLSIKLLGEEIPFRLNHSEAKAILTTKNQLKKVLGSFGRVENKAIRVVYLDDDPDAARVAAAELGIPADRLIGFDEARAAGRTAMASVSAALDRSIEAVGEDDTVTICYTSGTTGNPKGIMLTHLNYWTNCHDGVEVIRIPEGWRSLIILPVDHSFAHTAGLYTALVCCIALYFTDSRGGGIATLRNIPINLLETNPHFLFTVPALSGNFMKKIIAGVEEKGGIIEKLFKAGIRAGIAWNGNGFDRPPFGTRLRAFLPYTLARLIVFKTVARKVFGTSIRFCVGGGALLDVKQQQFFAALGVPVYQGYGLTEATPIISTNTPNRHKFGTSGVLMPSIEVKIVKSDGSPAAVGETGEIVMRGGSVMKGYFKNPEATAQALRDGWLYTGDLAYIDKDRFLVVVGREKALLIAEDGEKYSPEEIEEAVTFSTDTIDQIMAWCDQKKYTTALVTLDTGRVETMVKARGIRTAEDLAKALQDEFARYKADPKAKKVQANWMPAVFQVVAEGFSDKDGTVNSTMKIVRHRIVELHRGLIDYSYTTEGSKTMNPRNLETLRAMFKLG
ncbi:MAG: AMP-dependent synthetase [Spirochaetes bacterium RBG_13_68_11]|nr:MAG: AMP-dependent synthetase [Spirochaetes bacterium RBG_13_68_11]